MPVRIDAVNVDPASPLSSSTVVAMGAMPWRRQWQGCVSREGYMLLTGTWRAGAEDWSTVAELRITVSQHHRDWSATHRLHACARQAIGVEFYTDGTAWTLTIELRSIDGRASAGEFHLTPFEMYIAVVDVNGVPSAFDFSSLTGPSRNVPITLFNANQGGLMNRLVSLLSVIETATRLGCPAKGWWAPNAHCAANFVDLFELDGSGIVPAPTQATVTDFRFYYDYLPGEPPLDLVGASGTQIIHSTAPIRTSIAAQTTWEAVGDTFRRLQLAGPIRRKLEAFADVDFARVIGFHIRRPYPNGAFAAQEQAKFALGEEVFVNLLDDLRTHHPELERALICTNDPALEARILDRFPGYAFTFVKESIDNTVDPMAVQEALVDVTLLSRCAVLFSQSMSSFAVVASAIGKSRLFCLTPESSARTYDIWRFDVGQHNANFVAHRDDFAVLSREIRQWLVPAESLFDAD